MHVAVIIDYLPFNCNHLRNVFDWMSILTFCWGRRTSKIAGILKRKIIRNKKIEEKEKRELKTQKKKRLYSDGKEKGVDREGEFVEKK